MQITEIDRPLWPKISHRYIFKLYMEASPWGPCLIGETEGKLAFLSFWDNDIIDQEGMCELFRQYWPGAEVAFFSGSSPHWPMDKILNQMKTYQAASLEIIWMGTAFQRSVWRELLQIVLSNRVAYQDIAEKLNSPKAFRAVGSAVGSNPISLLVPCHRVLPKSGGVGGYAWGSERKSSILGFEDSL